MYVGMLIKDFAVGKKFDKSGVPNKSGAEFHCENHAKLLIEKGDKVTIFTKKKYIFTKAREDYGGIDLCRLHAPFRWLEISIRLLTSHKNVDCFYIFGTPKFSVWAVLIAKYILHKPTTLVLTGVAEIFNKNKNWRTKILCECDNYIGGSKELVDGLLNNAEIPADKIHQLPHGVDTVNRFFPVVKKEKMRLREKYNLPIDKFLVLFCARVVMNKGVDVMMKVWKKLYEKNHNIHLAVVGGGETVLLNELRKLSSELDNSITVFGEVDKADDFYKLADLYFFPSRYEGISTSLMEAMSSKLPIVASRIGGNVDIIKNDINGFLVDKEDVDGYVVAIQTLVDNPSEAKRFADVSRAYAVENLDCRNLLIELRYILMNKKE